MAVAFPTTRDFGIKSLGVGTNNTTTYSAVTLTVGRGLLALVEWGDASAVITVSGVSLSTDGALTAAAAEYDRGFDARGRYFYLPTITTGTQDLTVTYTNDTNAGALIVAGLEVTGHDTSDMTGATAGATDALAFSPDLTTEAANSAVVVALQVSSAESANVTGHGTWTKFDHANAQNAGALSYNVDVGAAGAKSSIAWDAFGYWAHAVEIKAAAGSDVSTALSGSAATPGIGTQAPGTAVPL